MTNKGLISTLLLASLFAATSGCIQQNPQTQGYRTVQAGQSGHAQVASANTPCTPSTTSSLIATGRSLMDMATSVIETRNKLNDGETYMRDVADTTKVSKGKAMLDTVENLTGGPQQPCN